MCWMTQDLTAYCFSKSYHDYYAEACRTTPLKPSQRTGIYGNTRGTSNGSGANSMASPVTIHEVDQGIKHDKKIYHDEKDGKYFSECDENVATVTQMDRTHGVFYEYDVPKDVE
jgi:hypothetical protein